MNIKPLNDIIIFDKLNEEKKTKTGIIIPEAATQTHFMKGKVVAVGPGIVIKRGFEEVEFVPMDVQVGETIVALKNACTEIELEGHKYYMVAQAQALTRIV